MRVPVRPAAVALVLAACSAKSPPPPASASAQAPAPQPAPQRSDAACAGPFETPPAGKRVRAPAGELRLGIVSGLKNADEDNVAHLRRLVEQLLAGKPDVLVADGDLGDNVDEQETLLGVLTATGLPTVVVAGNREARSDLDAAEAGLRQRAGKIFDLSHTRALDLGDAVLVGLAGAFERRQLHADGACLYVQRDLDALSAALDRLAPGPPVVLIAAVPPRGQDARALDVSEGQNIGDPRLAALLRKAPFGIFAQVWESGGRAIDAQGRPVPQGTRAPQLYLNPGAADRTPWPMADGSSAAGLAALLVIRDRAATWQRVEAR